MSLTDPADSSDGLRLETEIEAGFEHVGDGCLGKVEPSHCRVCRASEVDQQCAAVGQLLELVDRGNPLLVAAAVARRMNHLARTF